MHQLQDTRCAAGDVWLHLTTMTMISVKLCVCQYSWSSIASLCLDLLLQCFQNREQARQSLKQIAPTDRPAHLEEVDVSGIAALHAMPPQPPGQAALQLINDLCAPRHEARRPVLAHLPVQDTVLLRPSRNLCLPSQRHHSGMYNFL